MYGVNAPQEELRLETIITYIQSAVGYALRNRNNYKCPENLFSMERLIGASANQGRRKCRGHGNSDRPAIVSAATHWSAKVVLGITDFISLSDS